MDSLALRPYSLGGLKFRYSLGFRGTTEVVPFQICGFESTTLR